MIKNDEANISLLQKVLFGATDLDSGVIFADSKRGPVEYQKHNTPLNNAYHVMKKFYIFGGFPSGQREWTVNSSA